MNQTQFGCKKIFKVLLFLAFFLTPVLTRAQSEPPPRMSVTQELRWEVDQIPPEPNRATTQGDTIFINNHLCPLSRTEIGEPVDRLSKGFVYNGRNKALKGKTFVFNFCCVSCRDRFHKHFAKFPDEVLGKFGLYSNDP